MSSGLDAGDSLDRDDFVRIGDKRAMLTKTAGKRYARIKCVHQ